MKRKKKQFSSKRNAKRHRIEEDGNKTKTETELLSDINHWYKKDKLKHEEKMDKFDQLMLQFEKNINKCVHSMNSFGNE